MNDGPAHIPEINDVENGFKMLIEEHLTYAANLKEIIESDDIDEIHETAVDLLNLVMLHHKAFSMMHYYNYARRRLLFNEAMKKWTNTDTSET